MCTIKPSLVIGPAMWPPPQPFSPLAELEHTAESKYKQCVEQRTTQGQTLSTFQCRAVAVLERLPSGNESWKEKGFSTLTFSSASGHQGGFFVFKSKELDINCAAKWFWKERRTRGRVWVKRKGGAFYSLVHPVQFCCVYLINPGLENHTEECLPYTLQNILLRKLKA